MTFELPPLPYAYDALEPDFDAQTMEIHYTKHHQGYLDKLNKVAEDQKIDSAQGIEAVLATIDEESTPSLRNNAGGYYNHNLFWEGLTPVYQEPSERWKKFLNQEMGQMGENMDYFKQSMVELCASRFGSGWAWIVVREDGTTMGITTANQDNPLMPVVINEEGHKYIPLFGIDLWEHAYYLKYQNRKNEYIHAVLDHINWEVVEKRYFDALEQMGIPCPVDLS